MERGEGGGCLMCPGSCCRGKHHATHMEDDDDDDVCLSVFFVCIQHSIRLVMTVADLGEQLWEGMWQQHSHTDGIWGFQGVRFCLHVCE